MNILQYENDFLFFIFKINFKKRINSRAVMAEWLRRLTRIKFLIHIHMEYKDSYQMGFSRAGSNPAHCEFFFLIKIYVTT